MLYVIQQYLQSSGKSQRPSVVVIAKNICPSLSYGNVFQKHAYCNKSNYKEVINASLDYLEGPCCLLQNDAIIALGNPDTSV